MACAISARRNVVALRQHPDQLAECRYRQCHDIRFRQFRLRNSALPQIVPRHGSNEDVRIGGNLHRLPAQPRLAISLICSIDKGLRLLFLNMSNTSEILPVGRTGFISIRPSGSLSTTILSPGCTPRCFKSSLRKVIWPLAVTVSVFMRLDVRQKRLTSKGVGHRTGRWNCARRAASPNWRTVAVPRLKWGSWKNGAVFGVLYGICPKQPAIPSCASGRCAPAGELEDQQDARSMRASAAARSFSVARRRTDSPRVPTDVILMPTWRSLASSARLRPSKHDEIYNFWAIALATRFK